MSISSTIYGRDLGPELTSLINKIGGVSAVSDALGVSRTAIYVATKRDGYPASWFVIIRDMCRQRGLPDPPVAYFKMRRSGTQVNPVDGQDARHTDAPS